MISKNVAIKLLPIVNNLSYDDGLLLYAQERLDSLHKDLENMTDIYDITRTQGRIAEIRMLFKLRDYSNTISKDK